MMVRSFFRSMGGFRPVTVACWSTLAAGFVLSGWHSAAMGVTSNRASSFGIFFMTSSKCRHFGAADIGLSAGGSIFVKTTKIMTTQELAARYREMMNQRKFLEIQDTYYHPDVVSQEMEKASAMGLAVITNGIDAVKAKGIARRNTIEEIHSYDCSEPIVAGEFFSVVLKQELTFKGRPRVAIEEIAVFQVKDGKVVKEQFFY